MSKKIPSSQIFNFGQQLTTKDGKSNIIIWKSLRMAIITPNHINPKEYDGEYNELLQQILNIPDDLDKIKNIVNDQTWELLQKDIFDCL